MPDFQISVQLSFPESVGFRGDEAMLPSCQPVFKMMSAIEFLSYPEALPGSNDHDIELAEMVWGVSNHAHIRERG